MATSGADSFDHNEIDVNGIRLHYASAGDGALIVFLHGFPYCWYEFRHQLREFSKDHFVVAPDLRGYNRSGKPEHLQDAGVVPAVEDIRQLVEHLGYERFTLVGHDWGAVIGWAFAIEHPQLLEQLVILATAHPALAEREIRETPEQQEAWQYMLFLRAPNSEELLAADDFALLAEPLAEIASEEDLSVYKEAWRQPGALSGMLSYYRREGVGPETEDGTAAHGDTSRHLVRQVVDVPTLVIYPDADAYTRPGSHRGLERYVPDLSFKTIEGGSHWLVEEHPQLVNEWIREFLSRETSGQAEAAA